MEVVWASVHTNVFAVANKTLAIVEKSYADCKPSPAEYEQARKMAYTVRESSIWQDNPNERGLAMAILLSYLEEDSHNA